MTIETSDWSFHHLGLACTDIVREERSWAAMGYRRETEPFEDPRQGIRGVFLTCRDFPRLELLEHLPGATTLDSWLERGIKIYHQAYMVPDVEAALAECRGNRAVIVVPPTPAIAFAGRLIAFAMLSNRALIEVIEAGEEVDGAKK